MTPLIPNYKDLAMNCKVNDDKIAELKILCAQLEQKKERYQKAMSLLNLPIDSWKWLAAIHYRESSNDFSTCLHNGDPLPGPTKHVPSGRGPFSSWEEAAIDALKFDDIDKNTDWTLPGLLLIAEKYNGLGYRKHGVLSPYVWAGTNQYTSGLYVADGSFDESKTDKRFGVAAILLGLGD